MIPWLAPETLYFPPVETALEEPNGLLAAGGDLSSARLIAAYSQGIFPWYNENAPILWWSPSPRCVLFPDELHISKSLAKCLRQQHFTVTADQAFADVMRGCAGPRNYTDETWITSAMFQAYCRLHEQGIAHSVEAWQDGKLVGGLYGIALGYVFFGESMFSLASNASKVAFVHLVKALQQAGFTLIDCQVSSSHLQSLGAREISRNDFQAKLKNATKITPLASPWHIINQ